jgi:hypothetical protein
MNPSPDLENAFRPRRKAKGKAQLKRGKPVIENYDSDFWRRPENADKVRHLTGYNKSQPGARIRATMAPADPMSRDDAVMTFNIGGEEPSFGAVEAEAAAN